MARAGAFSDLFSLPVRNGEQTGWLEASSLFEDDGQRLQEMVMAHGKEHWKTDNRHAAGSAFLIAYLTRVTWPLISQYVLERRVIDARLSNLAFHWDGQTIDGTFLKKPAFAVLPADPASELSEAEVVPGPEALYARLKECLFDSNFAIVIPALRREVRASTKVSWNSVAASCAQAFNRLYDVVEKPEIVVQDANAFFGDPSSPVFEQVTMEEFVHQGKRGFFSRRAGCCLRWRTDRPTSYCSNCILLTRDEQDARFRQILERQ